MLNTGNFTNLPILLGYTSRTQERKKNEGKNEILVSQLRSLKIRDSYSLSVE